MVLDLLTLTAIPTAVGASEAVHQQRVLDEEAESEERQAPFHLDVYCDAQSRKRNEVHGAIVVLRDGKLCLWPKDPHTKLPKDDSDSDSTPHPFTGFYLPFPTEDLPHRPIPAPPILGLVSTIPSDTSTPKSKHKKPKLNWIYADKQTRELKYGPRIEAREHIVGPWDWTEDDEQGLTLNGEECLVAVEEEEKSGLGWAVYWDKDDDRLKGLGVAQEKRVLRCSLERRLVHEPTLVEVE
ncbi:hypothetical protein BU26DRAFT_431050 [Trematosphaeria pertusa]|uniref:Uncharacterized protein n=1 Tax=Trematosphaeria pertusa TaxID=390896 RepID=A0A6A6I867_9PLEO|nr:uncharacterized protein BU26DRAFT_431050 [Trematosphaeria pertusa]KAF2246477.1 hypothetical protein BU26DRAFT_431050 [Trematosphaeria pertusa]